LVPTFNGIADEYGVDPCLLAALCYEESSWNKFALSFDGDFGRGLCQIDAEYHPFAEDRIVYEFPERVVGQSVNRPGKAVDSWASAKNGAPVFDAHLSLAYACENLIVPALKHFAVRPNQVECALASYNAGISAVDRTVARGEDPRHATYGADYVDSILKMRATLAAASKACMP
jgi:hypothetical protein